MGVVTQLVGARLLCAVALASMMPISQSILTDAVPSSRRGAAFGKLGFWSSMGQVPPLTPFGWSKCFPFVNSGLWFVMAGNRGHSIDTNSRPGI